MHLAWRLRLLLTFPATAICRLVGMEELASTRFSLACTEDFQCLFQKIESADGLLSYKD